VDSLYGVQALPGKGLQGWKKSLQVFDAEGYKLGDVFFGGREDVHVKATSAAANVARARVVGLFNAKTARVDTRIDTLKEWSHLEELCREAAGAKALVTYIESHRGGVDAGRTLMVGSPKSHVRVRVYEKWLESRQKGGPEYEEGTNRVEVQFRPPSRAKGDVSLWTAAETFCATELTRRVAHLLGSEVAHPATVQKTKGTPDLERTLAAMGRQYGRAVGRWLEASAGDVSKVLDHLGVTE